MDHGKGELVSAISTGTEKIGDRLTIIGTIHVDPESLRLVSQTIQQLRPQTVGLELDQTRLAALTESRIHGNPMAGGLSFFIMMVLERFAGNLTGSAPGSEMLQAVDAARRVGSRIEFVDLPISNTIMAIRKLSLAEKLKLTVDSLISISLLPLAKLSFSKMIEDTEAQIRLFRRRYPELGRILLDQREEYMTKRIMDIMNTTTGNVVIVVGYGHMKTLARRLGSVKTTTGFSTMMSWILST